MERRSALFAWPRYRMNSSSLWRRSTTYSERSTTIPFDELQRKPRRTRPAIVRRRRCPDLTLASSCGALPILLTLASRDPFRRAFSRAGRNQRTVDSVDAAVPPDKGPVASKESVVPPGGRTLSRSRITRVLRPVNRVATRSGTPATRRGPSGPELPGRGEVEDYRFEARPPPAQISTASRTGAAGVAAGGVGSPNATAMKRESSEAPVT
jgi:hypothetical protein